jgi:hypothetical protein
MQLEFDRTLSQTLGYYRCRTCGSKFYGPGRAIHEPVCSETGYQRCSYVIGPQTVQAIKDWANMYGEESTFPDTMISLTHIRQQLPQAFKEREI